MQNRDFALGAADGVVNEIEFDLELLALLDLGAIGFQQRMRFGELSRSGISLARRSAAPPWPGCRHLGADGAQLGHDLAMHRTDVAVLDRFGIGMSPRNASSIRKRCDEPA